MIRISQAVCENVAGQIKTSPKYRTEQMLNDVMEGNPEFINGVSEIFDNYIAINEQQGLTLPPELVDILRRNAALFSVISWKIIQTQAECNELRDNNKRPMGQQKKDKRPL